MPYSVEGVAGGPMHDWKACVHAANHAWTITPRVRSMFSRVWISLD